MFGAMLRIITTETEAGQKWVLHGQLAGPWAAELQSNWDKASVGIGVVDLTDVTFIDEAGARVLCAMVGSGIKFIAGGVDTQQLLKDLKGKSEPPLRRCLSWLTDCKPSKS